MPATSSLSPSSCAVSTLPTSSDASAGGGGGDVVADSDSLLFREDDARYRDLAYPASVLGTHHVAAAGAEIALDVDAVLCLEPGTQAVGRQVERIFLHRAAFDSIHRALVGARKLFESLLDQRDEGGFAAGGRAEQQQYSLAYLQPAGRRGEVFDDAVYGVVLSVHLVVEQRVPGAAALVGLRDAAREYRVIHQMVR